MNASRMIIGMRIGSPITDGTATLRLIACHWVVVTNVNTSCCTDFASFNRLDVDRSTVDGGMIWLSQNWTVRFI